MELPSPATKVLQKEKQAKHGNSPLQTPRLDHQGKANAHTLTRTVSVFECLWAKHMNPLILQSMDKHGMKAFFVEQAIGSEIAFVMMVSRCIE